MSEKFSSGTKNSIQTNKQCNIFALSLSLKICLLRNWVKVAKIKQWQIFICFQYCNFTWRVQLTSILCWKPFMKWQFYLTHLTYFHLVLKALYEVLMDRDTGCPSENTWQVTYRSEHPSPYTPENFSIGSSKRSL